MADLQASILFKPDLTNIDKAISDIKKGVDIPISASVDSSFNKVINEKKKLGTPVDIPVSVDTDNVAKSTGKLKKSFEAVFTGIKKSAPVAGNALKKMMLPISPSVIKKSFDGIKNGIKSIDFKGAGNSLKKSFGDISKSFTAGDFTGVMDGITGAAGGVSKALGPVGVGITAVGTAAIAGAKFLYEYNQELQKNKAIVSTYTTATGAELTQLTAKLTASSQTLGVETKDLAKAGQSVANAWGGDLSSNVDALNSSLLNVTGSEQEFLDVVTEFSPQFKEFGFTAEQSFKTVEAAIKKGIDPNKVGPFFQEFRQKIAEMGTGTQEAIQGIGLDPAQIQKDVASGKSLIDVMQDIREAQTQAGVSAQQAQLVFADVFGSPAEDLAGFSDVLINTAAGLDSVAKSTDGVKSAQAEALEANIAWEQALAGILDVGSGFGDITTSLKKIGAVIINSVAPAIKQGFGLFKTLVEPIWQLITDIVDVVFDLGKAFASFGQYTPYFQSIKVAFAAIYTSIYTTFKGVSLVVNVIKNLGKLVIGYLVQKFKSAWSKISGFIQPVIKIVNAIKNGLISFVSGLIDGANELIKIGKSIKLIDKDFSKIPNPFKKGNKDAEEIAKNAKSTAKSEKQITSEKEKQDELADKDKDKNKEKLDAYEQLNKDVQELEKKYKAQLKSLGAENQTTKNTLKLLSDKKKELNSINEEIKKQFNLIDGVEEKTETGNEQLIKLEKELETVGEQIDKSFGKTSQAEMDKLIDKYKETKSKIDFIKDSIDKLKTSTRGFDFGALEVETIVSGTLTKAVETEIKDAQATLKDLGEEYDITQSQIYKDAIKNSITQTKSDLGEYKDEIDKTTKELDIYEAFNFDATTFGENLEGNFAKTPFANKDFWVKVFGLPPAERGALLQQLQNTVVNILGAVELSTANGINDLENQLTTSDDVFSVFYNNITGGNLTGVDLEKLFNDEFKPFVDRRQELLSELELQNQQYTVAEAQIQSLNFVSNLQTQEGAVGDLINKVKLGTATQQDFQDVIAQYPTFFNNTEASIQGFSQAINQTANEIALLEEKQSGLLAQNKDLTEDEKIRLAVLKKSLSQLQTNKAETVAFAELKKMLAEEEQSDFERDIRRRIQLKAQQLQDEENAEQARRKLLEESFQSVGELLVNMFDKGANAADTFLVALIDAMQTYLTAMVPVWIAGLYGTSVLELGPAGVAVAAGLTGVILALAAKAKASLASAAGAEGGDLNVGVGTPAKPGKTDKYHYMLAKHEAVINAQSAQKFKGLLQAVNDNDEGGIGKWFVNEFGQLQTPPKPLQLTTELQGSGSTTINNKFSIDYDRLADAINSKSVRVDSYNKHDISLEATKFNLRGKDLEAQIKKSNKRRK